ncbi:uncharacterized protein LOC132735916 [Ruditapes philippinarum]|uniref:uncharacterized protein LOC132735916 n=1 Tax=Ruditapes philippinarum TaxID=129788 RepID=UPI00295B5236|nr:uncharacterized protein LOC132735916 [Ruditapes philippinarum]
MYAHANTQESANLQAIVKINMEDAKIMISIGTAMETNVAVENHVTMPVIISYVQMLQIAPTSSLNVQTTTNDGTVLEPLEANTATVEAITEASIAKIFPS